MDIRQALHAATDRLTQAGCDSPRLDAELLLGCALGLNRAQLLARWEQPLSGEAQRAYNELVQRRADREPLAYITGHKEFFGLDFEVNRHVLIPRPETELLVELAVDVVRRLAPDGRDASEISNTSVGRLSTVAKDCPDNHLRLVDIGTGSGVIAVSLAVSLPDAIVSAVDRSEDALAVAARNCERHGVSSRVRLFQGDLMAPIDDPVDIVAANLPYVRRDELETLSPEIRLFEPAAALDGGADGLDLIRRLLRQIASLPVRPRTVLLEIGATQGQAVLDIVAEIFTQAQASLHQDYAGLDRIVMVEL